MTFRNRMFLSAAALAMAAVVSVQPAFVPVAAAAQAAMSVGAVVKDTAGGEVGTITAVDGANVTLKTDKHEVQLPTSSFAATDSGFIMGMTQAELNAAVEQTMAAAAEKIAVGAVVKDTKGGTVGTIDAIADGLVTVKLSNGLVQLPHAAFAATPDGPVIGMTAAELEAQVSAASTPA
ncbi:hypothetical protein [Allosphingosinicella humi]